VRVSKPQSKPTAEHQRLKEDADRTRHWKRWGPYLSERQWGTVREDYSANGDTWGDFTHEMSRSRAYRWGEDGLLGITDHLCRICFSVALWNGRDPILKERLFGLTGPEGNHGEDVKEQYFYLDSTPTHSYMKALYKYPQAEFPYARLIEENARRGKDQREFELLDTGVFDQDRYFDVFAEYAKGSPNDLCIKLTVHNRGPERADLHLLPQVWLRNTWAWGREGEGYYKEGLIERTGEGQARAAHESLGTFRFTAEPRDGKPPELLFTGNETNIARCFGGKNRAPYVKDGFHEFVIGKNADAVSPEGRGTKCAAHYTLSLAPGESTSIRLRLCAENEARPAAFDDFDGIFGRRLAEADAFYATVIEEDVDDVAREVSRQAYAGLLWSKQFYNYVIGDWLEGDPAEPRPPESRKQGRNHTWPQLYNRDVISMPDKWEYPWYAAWDLAFHTVPLCRVDPEFAKGQLVLMLREWYMHPNGQLPAYEFNFSDVNPPVHAWAAWRVYKMTAPRGQRDRTFLARVFNKLLLNFTWWVNRKDAQGNNLFSGGFLGLDNIGVFDRSRPLPTGGQLEQADGTAWMGFFCVTMLSMALELAREDPAYEDLASKFFEHFVAIADAVNDFGGHGLWDEDDGFYYDQISLPGGQLPLKVRSMVGLIPLFAVGVLEQDHIEKLPGFAKRMQWFLENRKDLAKHIAYLESHDARPGHGGGHRLLALPSRERLTRVLRYLLDENEFLSPYGIRSLSKVHAEKPFELSVDGDEYRVAYAPAESDSGLFGGNSNWRGPIWFPVNFLLIEALEGYHHFYGDSLQVEHPVGSGRMMNLKQVADELSQRLVRLFLPDAKGNRPCHGEEARFASDPAWRELVLFYEHFHGETGRGLGASHQTGWTALVARFIESRARGA